MPAVIHGHNLHGGYFDLRQLRDLSSRAPMALTLHDEWLLTGHCAYSNGCDRWVTGCGACPDLTLYPALRRDGTSGNRRRKSEIYQQSRLYVSSPSAWLLERARRSILNEGAVDWQVIHNGVDRSVFRPGSSLEARRRLDLPLDAWILLFVANWARSNRFKDYETVVAAARRISDRSPDRRVILIVLGEQGPSERVGKVELRLPGYERDPNVVAQYHRAADLYVHAARNDNFPTTVLEALSTGVAVVATAVGGIPEQVRSLSGVAGAYEGKSYGIEEATGVLVDPADSEGMAAAATALLEDDPTRTTLAANATRDAAARFDIEAQIDRTIDWYRAIQTDWRAARGLGA
jgi:glycosyltransferase involved in cell wall biosynthesis